VSPVSVASSVPVGVSSGAVLDGGSSSGLGKRSGSGARTRWERKRRSTVVVNRRISMKNEWKSDGECFSAEDAAKIGLTAFNCIVASKKLHSL